MIHGIPPSGQIESLVSAESAKNRETGQGAPGFGEMLAKAVGEVNQRYDEADQAVADLAAGRSRDVHQTMIAMEKADVSFRLLMQVRNKIVSAYETVMRTQV